MGGPGSGRRPGATIKDTLKNTINRLSSSDRKAIEDVGAGLGIQKSKMRKMNDTDISALVKAHIKKRM